MTSGYQHTMLDSARKLYEIRKPIAEQQPNAQKLIRNMNIEITNYVASYILSLIEWRISERDANIKILEEEQKNSLYQNIQTDYFKDPLRILIMQQRFVEAYTLAEKEALKPKDSIKLAIRRFAKIFFNR